MFRSMSRMVVAAAVVLALTAFTVPAQAQPFDIEVSAFDLSDSWLGAALAWLHEVVTGGGAAERPLESAAAASAGGSGSGSGGGSTTPMTGSCIDPQGGGKWCGV